MRIVVRLAAAAVALWVASEVVAGIDLGGGTTTDRLLTLFVVAAVFSLATTFLRPVLTVLSLPFIVITLGLFLIVINAALLLLTGWVADLLGAPFVVEGFWAAVLGSLVISVTLWVIDLVLPERYER